MAKMKRVEIEPLEEYGDYVRAGITRKKKKGIINKRLVTEEIEVVMSKEKYKKARKKT